MCINLREEQFADSTTSDNIPEFSKREYLLAQIRQKDAIIESLLKQVRITFAVFEFYVEVYSSSAAQPLLGHTPLHCVVSNGNLAI